MTLEDASMSDGGRTVEDAGGREDGGAAADASDDDAGTLEDGGAEDGGVDAGTLDTGVPPGPVGRTLHTATLLQDGRVLVTGGLRGDTAPLEPLASAAVYDPATESFTPTLPMSSVRYFHTATLLENGQVLVAGGSIGRFDDLATAELFDPATNSFTPTGSMGNTRASHAAHRIPGGEVLVYGGQDVSDALAEQELYDPVTGMFAFINPGLSINRNSPILVPLADERVLLTGGTNDATESYLFDPADDSFTPTGDLTTARQRAASIGLPDGRALVIGGGDQGSKLASAEVFDPTSGQFTVLTSTMSTASDDRRAVMIDNDTIMLLGGTDESFTPLGVELFKISTETFEPSTATGFSPRSGHTATVLNDGRVLVIGGAVPGGTTDTCLLYDPATDAFTPTGALPSN